MKIGVLAAGITPDALLQQYGSYADMVIQLLAGAEPSFEFEVFDVRDDQFPLSATACDGWVITGSRANVYQNLPWMVRLKRLILEIHEAGRPLVGICFGHQIIAEAFGGKVEKFDGGWGIGLQSYRLVGDHGYADAGAEQFSINAIHQDQVTELPASARVVASSEFCRYAALAYGDRILTVQSHPEFSIDFEEALLELTGGVSVPAEAAQQGLERVRAAGAATDSPTVARWMAAVLKLASGEQPAHAEEGQGTGIARAC